MGEGVLDDEWAACRKHRSFSNRLKEEDCSWEPEKVPPNNHVAMISQRKKPSGDVPNTSKHPQRGLFGDLSG